MPFDDYGQPTFDLEDVKIATWNGVGDYGSAVDIPSARVFTGEVEIRSGRLEGDARITSVASKTIAGAIEIEFGSISLEAYEVLTGISAVESGTTPTRKKTLTISEQNMPYVAICGKAEAAEGEVTGDTHVFIPKCKIVDNFTPVSLQIGEFAVPRLRLLAIQEGNLWGIISIVEHETAVDVTIPPVTT